MTWLECFGLSSIKTYAKNKGVSILFCAISEIFKFSCALSICGSCVVGLVNHDGFLNSGIEAINVLCWKFSIFRRLFRFNLRSYFISLCCLNLPSSCPHLSCKAVYAFHINFFTPASFRWTGIWVFIMLRYGKFCLLTLVYYRRIGIEANEELRSIFKRQVHLILKVSHKKWIWHRFDVEVYLLCHTLLCCMWNAKAVLQSNKTMLDVMVILEKIMGTGWVHSWSFVRAKCCAYCFTVYEFRKEISIFCFCLLKYNLVYTWFYKSRQLAH